MLECHEDQVVDVVALVKTVSEPVTITTAFGDHLKVDVTIMDDSARTSPRAASSRHGFPNTVQMISFGHSSTQ